MDFQEEFEPAFLTTLGLKHRFAAIDLAPNEHLESGFSALDRERVLVRMDKLYKDEEMITAIETIGPASGTIVVIDMPKNLSIPNRWRQEEIKMHPLRAARTSKEPFSRYETRGMKLCQMLKEKGILAFLYFNYWTRLNYEMLIPFRSRSPHGCRALQAAIENQLGIKNLPTNLAPSSVLESMVGAYASWSVWAGTYGVDYEIQTTPGGQDILIPKALPHQNRVLRRVPRPRRSFRKGPPPPRPANRNKSRPGGKSH